MTNTKKLALTAIFAAAAIALSTLENLVPLGAFIPIPGLRLGIANLAVMAAYYIIGRKSAAAVGILKVLVVFFTFGNASSLVISFCGTLLAFISLVITEKINLKIISFIGASACSAVFHALGQVLGACLLTDSAAPFAVIVPLTLCSVATGALTGFLMNCVYSSVGDKIKMK